MPFLWANVDRLTGRGLMEIGELPDPAGRMLQSLEALEQTIAARDDLQPEQKRQVSQALEEFKHFLRGLPPGAAVELGSTFIRGMLGG